MHECALRVLRALIGAVAASIMPLSHVWSSLVLQVPPPHRRVHSPRRSCSRQSC